MSLLALRELGEDGDGEAFVGSGFGVWEVPFLVAEVAEAFLQVEWKRVIDFGADAVLCEEGSQLVAVWNPDDELVVDVVIGEAGVQPRFHGKGESCEFRGVGEGLSVPARFCASFSAPEIEVR